MSKLFRKAVAGGKGAKSGDQSGRKIEHTSAHGSTSSSSEVQRLPAFHQNDEEVARALSKEINAGYDEPDSATGQQPNDSGYPDEIENSITHVQTFAKEALSTTCYECDGPLIENLDVEDWMRKWKKGVVSAAVECECGATTCLGCADEARCGSSKYMGQYEGAKLDWCCYKGAAFIAWVLLSYYDHLELNLQAKSQHVPTTAQRDRRNGVGFGENIRSQPGAMIQKMGVDGKAQYFVPGLKQALNFQQADSKTDGMTSWIFGMLIALLPKKEETTKKDRDRGLN
ncbi:MAG: hypothetical protein Q9168_006411 [Polycauliona sp. 1 TL-2023]